MVVALAVAVADIPPEAAIKAVAAAATEEGIKNPAVAVVRTPRIKAEAAVASDDRPWVRMVRLLS